MENFIKIKTIGKGTFGSVVLVQRRSDHKFFAIKKIYLQEGNYSPQNEIKILESLNHPNIIKYYESFIQSQKLYIVTEYAAQGDLSQLIKQHIKNQQLFQEDFIFKTLNQITKAMIYLFDKKILHRDIKSQNILLDEHQNIKIGDFGISKQLDNSNELAKTSLGTPYYLSPEICRNEQYDHKTDMWMLGCLMYELVTLTRPFQGESLNGIINNIMFQDPLPITNYSQKLTYIITKLLQKNKEDRLNVYELSQILKDQQIIQQIKQKNLYFNKLTTPTTNESEYKKKRVMISIFTDQNNQEQRPETDKNGILNIIDDEFSENRPKSFSFGKSIFDGKTPTSPQRQILFQEFLKKRLGEDIYDRTINLINKEENPIEYLQENNQDLINMIGIENKETIKCFKMLFLQPQLLPIKKFNFHNYKN